MAGCLAAGGMAVAAEGPGIDPGTPQIPGTPWKVHDGSRPQPPVVENAGAVIVKPPGDAKVLFDGKSLDAWTTDGKPATWPVKDGIFTAAPGTLVSKDKFGPVQVHIEWRVPPGRPVKGQGGGNSGIFLMGLYEVQILQSHENPTYALPLARFDLALRRNHADERIDDCPRRGASRHDRWRRAFPSERRRSGPKGVPRPA